MAIYAKQSNKEVHLPTAGLHKGVLCDVHDLGIEESRFGLKEKVLFVWEIDEEHPKFGGPHRVNKKYTNSLHEKSTLSQDLESWRGRSYTPEQRKQGVDLEKMIGIPCMLNIIHNETDSGTYANIRAVFPMQKGVEPLKVSEGYVRMKDRPNGQQQAQPKPQPVAEPDDDFDFEEDDDLPF